MKEGAFTKEDFSLREIMEQRVRNYAQDIFEDLKKFSKFPEYMDDIQVRVELTLLKPIGKKESDKDAGE